jgi:hypothetical protein
MEQDERPMPQEFSRAAYNAANSIWALMRAACEYPRDWSPGVDWTVAIPVAVGTGVPVADDAPRATAVRILFAGDDATGLGVIEPGDRLVAVGGTNGHMLWPPATVVFEVLSGSLTGSRVQFVLDPDPRPAGEAASTAGAALLRTDEPVFADVNRLSDLRAAITSVLSPGSGA